MDENKKATETTEEENRLKILKSVQNDYNSCNPSKTRVSTAISKWLKEYNGDSYGNEVKNRSSIVVKDIKKTIVKMAPSIIQPFIASDTIIKCRAKTIESVATADMSADVLNYQYNNLFDKLHFIRTIANVFPKEGTIVVRTGWDFYEEVQTKDVEGIDAEALVALEESGENITYAKENDDGTYNVTISKTKTVKNQPTAVVCKNESIRCDPTAEKFADCKFVTHEFEQSYSDIRKNGNIYEIDSVLAQIEAHLDSSNKKINDTLAAKRYQDGYNNGMDKEFKFDSKANKKLILVEYWGEYDLKGTGIAEQIVCTWIKDTDIILRLEANPYPDKKIPFVSRAFVIEPFAIWGNSIADSISDNQKIRTAIMRGFIDNLSLSNNGSKIFRKGAVDYINQQKLMNGEKLIEVNDLDGIRDGSFNQIPGSSFDVYNIQDSEIAELTGISKNLDGIDSATIGRTSSGVQSTMSAAQRHLVIIVSIISDLYKEIFIKWNAYNQEFLDEGQAVEIAGSLVQLSKDQIRGEHNVELTINVDSLNSQKIQQINMLLQQTQNMQGAIPPMVVPSLVAEFFSASGKEELAAQIREYKPEPDPFTEQMKQVQLQAAMLDNEMKKAEIELMRAKSMNTEAQATQHQAKTDNVDADTMKKAIDLKHAPVAQELDKQDKLSKIQKTNADIIKGAHDTHRQAAEHDISVQQQSIDNERTESDRMQASESEPLQ